MMVMKACFLQVKAFGDFVIACAAATRVAEADRARLTIAIGAHLRSLCDAVAPPVQVIALGTGEAGVPSIFDVRKNGVPAALRSLWRVRGAVARAPLDRSTQLLFDHVGWRERLIAAGHPVASIMPGTPNIYGGYARLLTDAGFRLLSPGAAEAGQRDRLGIFPGSRVAAKNLPAPLVAAVMDEAARRGVAATLFLLDGERPDLEASGVPHTVVPRQFTALRDAIASTDCILSADSLPAHLAESLAIPVFVLTPRPNAFWMPATVFEDGHWCLFDDPAWLERVGTFLAPV
ncbi:hypothetical protein ACT009_14660 [Sphingomonas sp. Tas61C01]|uniref:hypothetical protein n=1 Tax=Sphingomonas sp. Tas61C01 TaxID=3458297 RepID=UPI00403ECFA8